MSMTAFKPLSIGDIAKAYVTENNLETTSAIQKLEKKISIKLQRRQANSGKQPERLNQSSPSWRGKHSASLHHVFQFNETNK